MNYKCAAFKKRENMSRMLSIEEMIKEIENRIIRLENRIELQSPMTAV